MLGRQQKKTLGKVAVVVAIAAIAYGALKPGEVEYVVYLPQVSLNAIVPVHVVEKGVANTTNRCSDAYQVGARWHYNWGPNPLLCPGIDSVPMVGCKRHLEDLRNGASIASDSLYILGFNEPDLNQDPLTPEQAAILWRELEGYLPTKKLVSPAVSHLHPEWLEEFYNAYRIHYGEPPRLHGLAIHCYLFDAAQCKTVINQVIGYANDWQVTSVWVTEFAIRDQPGMSKEQALAESRELIEWMQAHPKVTHYAWFPSGTLGGEWWAEFGTYLTDETGRMTEWGLMYAASPKGE